MPHHQAYLERGTLNAARGTFLLLAYIKEIIGLIPEGRNRPRDLIVDDDDDDDEYV